MTDTEKYYTPKIEEFHVGFEYERYNELSNAPSYWQKEIFTANHKLNDWGYGLTTISPKYIRVKHLSHDDIVGCGWVEQPKADNQVFKGIGKYKKMCDTERDKQVEFTLYLMSNSWVLIAEAGETRFSGHILNKSELKLQMARLGIKQ